MKSALKKSVVSTSISLILASGMAAFAAHAADDVKLKATKTNVAFSDFTPTEYSTKGKPNIIVLTMDDLGYGQLPFDKGSFDPKTMENREVVDTYKIGIDKAIEAAQKSTPTLLSLMDEGVRFTNGYVAHGVSGPSRAAIMTGRAPARFGVYSNTDAQDGIPLTETFLPELFQNHGYYTESVMCRYRKINKHVTIMTTSPHFLRKNGNLKTVALITLWDSTLQERHITTPLHCSKTVNASPQKVISAIS